MCRGRGQYRHKQEQCPLFIPAYEKDGAGAVKQGVSCKSGEEAHKSYEGCTVQDAVDNGGLGKMIAVGGPAAI